MVSKEELLARAQKPAEDAMRLYRVACGLKGM